MLILIFLDCLNHELRLFVIIELIVVVCELLIIVLNNFYVHLRLVILLQDSFYRIKIVILLSFMNILLLKI